MEQLHPYAEAFAKRDYEQAVGRLAEDVTFHSPVIADTGFEGRAATAALLEIVFREIKGVAYTHAFGDADSQVLVANAEVRGVPVKVTTLLELAPDGKVREIWVMARPLLGLIAIAEAIGAGVAKRQVPARARLLMASMKPLSVLATATDRVGSRLVASLNRSV
jgi:hypothetical protein